MRANDIDFKDANVLTAFLASFSTAKSNNQ